MDNDIDIDIDTLRRERDEALAREAVLREALDGARKVVYGPPPLTLAEHKATGSLLRQMDAALTSTATVAAARDAALVARGQADGLRMAAQIDEGRLSDAREQGRREGIEAAAALVKRIADEEGNETTDEIVRRIRALAAVP